MGDDIGPALDERTLVIANHQSTSDVPLLMAAFNVKKGVLPNIMWIMDRMFKYTNFGAVSLLHQDFFIASVSTKNYLGKSHPIINVFVDCNHDLLENSRENDSLY